MPLRSGRGIMVGMGRGIGGSGSFASEGGGGGGGGGGWNGDIANATHDSFYSVSPIFPYGIAVKPDGTKIWIIDYSADSIRQYTMGTAWDATTTTSDGVSFNFASRQGAGRGLSINSDGTKLYVVGSSSDRVDEVTLSTPYDLSTASFGGSKSLAGGPRGGYWNEDGTNFYYADPVATTVYQATASTPYDVSTLGTATGYDVSGDTANQPSTIAVSPDEEHLYFTTTQDDKVHRYSFGTAGDITSITFEDDYYFGGVENSPTSLTFSPDGSKMIIGGTQGRGFDVFDVPALP